MKSSFFGSSFSTPCTPSGGGGFKRSAHSAWPTQWPSGRVGQGSSIIEFVPGLPCKLFSSFALVVLFVCSFVCLFVCLFYLLWLIDGC